VKLDAVFSPAEIEGSRLTGRAIAVIDVLRATSTILTALANGARAVIPVDTVERAVRTAREIGAGEALLCGERGSKPIDGFDLGNSPAEFAEPVVGGHTLVMTTTNGTRALLAGSAGSRCVVAAFLNVTAVAAALADEEDVVLLCAGRAGRFSLDDAVCAGMIAHRLGERSRVDATESARAAMVMAAEWGDSLVGMLRTTAAGRQLERLQMDGDIAYCGTLDRFEHVPGMNALRITL
jgi:2-phosphosulfolactate phosphatase